MQRKHLLQTMAVAVLLASMLAPGAIAQHAPPVTFQIEEFSAPGEKGLDVAPVPGSILLRAPEGMALVNETEPNDTPATANALTGSQAVVLGNISPANDVDYFSFTANAGDRVYAAMQTSWSNVSGDSRLQIIDSDGTTVLEFDDDDGAFGALSSAIGGTVIPATGTYYVRAYGYSATTVITPYHLHLRVQSGTPTPEVEPNNNTVDANPLPASGWVSGNISATTDPDVFSFSLDAGDSVFLALDQDPDRDPSNSAWDARLGLGLFGDGGNMILLGNGASSTRPNAEAFFMTVQQAGTYYAYIDSNSATGLGANARYHLSVSIYPKAAQANCTTFTSTDVPKTIGPAAGTVTSTITVPGTVTASIQDVNVSIQLTHALMADLDVNLVGPTSVDVPLFTDVGTTATGGQQVMNVGLDDQAALPIGTFTVVAGMIHQPEQPGRLASFNGTPAAGTWTLQLADDTTNTSGGELQGWSLEICGDPPQPYAIELTKTVGTVPGVCATTDSIVVPPGFDVYYCYTVRNIGLNALSTHDLVDSELGTLFTGMSHSLAPGDTYSYIEPATVNATVTNTATWTAHAGTNNASDSDTATVTVLAPTCPAGSHAVTLDAAFFDDPFPPASWTVTHTTTGCNAPGVPEWTNTNPGARANQTGGAGPFAIADSDRCGSGNVMDTIMSTGSLDFTGLTNAMVYYYTDFYDLSAASGAQALVDVSLDGGGTWSNLLTWNGSQRGPLQVIQALTGADGQSAVRVRWHYAQASWDWYWQVDDVAIVACAPDGPQDPDIAVSPASLAVTQGINAISTQTLNVANAGGGTLNWTITEEPAAVPPHGAPSVPENVTGSSLTAMTPAAVPPGATTTLCFTARITSPDAEYTDRFDIDLPDDWTIGAVAANSNPVANGCASSVPPVSGVDAGNVVYWQTRNSTMPSSCGAWNGGAAGTNFDFCVEVTVPSCTGSPWDIAWNIVGDGYGAAPHSTSGTFSAPCDFAVCTNPSDVPWLSLDVYSGATAGGATTPVTVTFDSAGLGVGLYEANLCIASDDPDAGPGNGTELVIVPVAMEVESTLGPAITLTKTVGTVPAVCATTDNITIGAGETVYYCYEVENTGDITFNFHDLADSALGVLLNDHAAVLAPGATMQWIESATPMATVTNTGTWTAMTALGTYEYDDTVAFNYVPINTTGTALNPTDDGEENITSPFPLTFYGVTSTSLRIGNNGGILFGATNGDVSFSNTALPNATHPMAIFPFWDDMGAGGNVYWEVRGTAPNRTLIVEWFEKPHYSNVGAATFEVIFFEGSSDILFQYLDTDFGNATYDFGASATVGINKDGTTALQYSFNQPVITDGLAIRFSEVLPVSATASDTATVTVEVPNIDVIPLSLSSTLAPDDTASLPLTIANTGTGTLTWTIAEEPVARAPEPITGGNATAPAAERVLPGELKPLDVPGVGAPPSAWRHPDAELWDNGPLVTHPGGGAGGADASALQTALGMDSYGFNTSATAGMRVADDFTVTGGGWFISTITFFGYQTGSSTTSTFTALNLRIWDGPPDQATSSVVWGDTTTNRLAGSVWSNIYRVLDTAMTNTDRPIMALEATVNTFLPAGTYWLDWQADGTLASGPWVAPISIVGQTTTGNAMQYTTADGWFALEDGGTATPQGLPFIIEGLADCSNPADVPWLAVSQTTGSNGAGTNTSLAVSFDSTGLAAGTYNARLCVMSNDPDPGPGNGTSLVIVPVEMIVVEDEIIHTVTASVGTPSGTIAPPSQTVADGDTATLTVVPDAGYEIDFVGGTCPAGSLAGNIYTTGPITADCEVIAHFRPEAGPGPSVLEIPTLGPAGGALLGLLLAGLGLGTLRRRRA